MGRASRTVMWAYRVAAGTLSLLIGFRVASARAHRDVMRDGPVSTVAVGDTLPNEALDVHDGGLRSQWFLTAKTTNLKGLAGTGCAIVIFFESTCPACEQMAPRWVGLRQLQVGDRSARVVWVSVNREDRGGTQFLRGMHVTGSWYAVRSLEQVHALGVRAWPTIYIIDSYGRLAGLGDTDPARVKTLPKACKDTLQGAEVTKGGVRLPAGRQGS